MSIALPRTSVLAWIHNIEAEPSPTFLLPANETHRLPACYNNIRLMLRY
jgi:hypothetical protein